MATDTLTTSRPKKATTTAKKPCRVVDIRSSLHVVRRKPNADLIVCLELLLQLARQGDVTGVAFVATLSDLSYITDAVGVCYEQPTYTRGMLATLADEMAGEVHRRDSDARR